MSTPYAQRRAQNRHLIEVFRQTNQITPEQARIYARNQGRNPADPLRIRAVRVAYLTQIEKRFARLASLIARSFRNQPLNVLAAKPIPRGALGGPADLAIAAFEAWLNETTLEVILGGTADVVVAPRRQFQRKFTERAFLEGLKAATSAAAAAGFTITDPTQLLGVPRSTEAVELLANRQYQLLIGYTQEMADRQREILIEGLNSHRTVEEISEQLVREVGIAENRAKRMARTEMTLAHSEANLNAFEAMGQTSVEFEFTTTSGNPCPICLGLAGQRFSITNAHGVIPVHPNCYCVFVPIETALRRAA